MKKGVLIFLLMVAMILIVTQGAFARTGSQTATGTFVETLVDPTAPGTKVTGILAITYDSTIGKKCSEIGGYPNEPPYTYLDAAKMTFTMRLYKNTILFPFSGSANVCYVKVEDHMIPISNFITDTVIPIVFKENPTATWKLKAVNNIIEDDNNNCPNPPTPSSCCGCCSEFFSIMDITIAVQ
jgi:hypothetical protein